MLKDTIDYSFVEKHVDLIIAEAKRMWTFLATIYLQRKINKTPLQHFIRIAIYTEHSHVR